MSSDSIFRFADEPVYGTDVSQDSNWLISCDKFQCFNLVFNVFIIANNKDTENDLVTSRNMMISFNMKTINDALKYLLG